MTDLVDQFERVLHGLQVAENPVAGVLQDGLSRGKIDSACVRIPYQLPDELYELYLWHNGTQTEETQPPRDWPFFNGFYFTPLKQAIHEYEILVKMAEFGDVGFKANWFPFLADADGNHYVYDGKSSPSSSIIKYSPDRTEQPVQFNSLCDMMRTIAQAYESGVIRYDKSDQCEDIDLDRFRDLAANLNPLIPFWPADIRDVERARDDQHDLYAAQTDDDDDDE